MSTTTLPVQIYSTDRAEALPSTTALATIRVALTLLAVSLSYLLYRAATRGERRQVA